MTDKEMSEWKRERGREDGEREEEEGVKGKNTEGKERGGVEGRDRKREGEKEKEGDGKSGAECGKRIRRNGRWM